MCLGRWVIPGMRIVGLDAMNNEYGCVLGGKRGDGVEFEEKEEEEAERVKLASKPAYLSVRSEVQNAKPRLKLPKLLPPHKLEIL